MALNRNDYLVCAPFWNAKGTLTGISFSSHSSHAGTDSKGDSATLSLPSLFLLICCFLFCFVQFGLGRVRVYILKDLQSLTSRRVPAGAGVSTSISFLDGILVIIMGQLFTFGLISLSEMESPH